MTLEGLVITGGFVEREGGLGGTGGTGGGIRNEGRLTVASSTISGNRVTLYGGGIMNVGTLAIEASTLSDNAASEGGGGIFSRGTATIARSTISGNYTAFNGGGIINAEGSLHITNSTISDNTASHSISRGAGIDNRHGGTLIVEGSTITGNRYSNPSQSSGAGIYNDRDSLLIVARSIMAGNPRGDCWNSGTLPDLGFNLVSDGTCGLTTAAVADVLVTDADGVPALADNGGPTETVALVNALVGAGPGGSAPHRLTALRNMLLAAGDRFEQGDVSGACVQLQDAADRTDGAHPPPDFVQGDAASDLLDAITAVSAMFGCSSGQPGGSAGVVP